MRVVQGPVLVQLVVGVVPVRGITGLQLGDKLGGGAWQARKARLKERIRQIADRLMRVAAERMLRAAPVPLSVGWR